MSFPLRIPRNMPPSENGWCLPLRETFRIPLVRTESTMQWLRMSKAEKDAMKYAPERLPPPELMYRMEDNIVSLCVKWVTDRLPPDF